MERLLKIGVTILIVLLLLPLVKAGCVSTTRGVDRALAEGTVKWEPVTGVIIERDCGDGTWEQEVIDWHGPGFRKLILPADSTRSTNLPELVWANVPYAYSRSKSRSSFHFRVESDTQQRSENEQRIRGLMQMNGAKEVPFKQGSLMFHEGARIRLSSNLRVGLRSVRAGTELQWGHRKWSVCAGQSDTPPRSDRLSALSAAKGSVTYASFNGPLNVFTNKEGADLLSALAQRGPEPSASIASFGDQNTAPMGCVICGLRCGSADPNGDPGYFKLHFTEYGDKPAVDYTVQLDHERLLRETQK